MLQLQVRKCDFVRCREFLATGWCRVLTAASRVVYWRDRTPVPDMREYEVNVDVWEHKLLSPISADAAHTNIRSRGMSVACAPEVFAFHREFPFLLMSPAQQLFAFSGISYASFDGVCCYAAHFSVGPDGICGARAAPEYYYYRARILVVRP